MDANGVPAHIGRPGLPYRDDRRSVAVIVPATRPQDPRTLAQRVADRLRVAIIHGELQGGQPLRQAELASRYGVSPIPLREALRQLEVEGFVTLHPYRGALVATLSAGEFRDLAEMFLALQSLALRLAAGRMDARTLERARGIIAAMKATDDRERWAELSLDLHVTLARASGRPQLAATIRGLLVNLSRYRLLARGAFRPRTPGRSAELLDACEKGDGAATVRVLQQHVATVTAEVESFLAAPLPAR